MKLLITGACGHIGSYLAQNIHKIKNVRKCYLIDNIKNKILTHFLKVKKK